ncbi:MAG: response regulator [Terrimicrobiaceae bacterium]
MLRVILVDDERLARQALRGLLHGLDDVIIVAEAASVDEARQALAAHPADAVFLDVHMPRADGFELLKAADQPPKVVFVTAYAQHAVRAFEFDAVDYLLKPVRRQRLMAAVERLRTACRGDTGTPTAYQNNDQICLRTPGRTMVTALDQLVLLEADGDFTNVTVEGQPPLMICRTLGSYEAELPSPPFLRLDRSTIINTTRLLNTERISRDSERVNLRGLAGPIIIGRAARQRLKNAIGS